MAKATTPKVQAEVELIDRDGKPTGDEGQAAAKRVRGKHYARFITGRIGAPFLYDPADEPDAQFDKQNRARGSAYYEFQPLTAESYQYYVRYLRSKNKAEYRAASQLAG